MTTYSSDSMMEMFLFETGQLIEQLEQIVLNSEKSNNYDSSSINEIFRIMHTIKGSSAMMLYNNISILAHSIEDIFYYIREENPLLVSFSELTDLILKGKDFIKTELVKIEEGSVFDANPSKLIAQIRTFLEGLKKINSSSETISTESNEKQKYNIGSCNLRYISTERVFKAVIYFEEDCEMEDIRAFSIVHSIENIASDIYYFPSDIMEADKTKNTIRKEGFKIIFRTGYSIDRVREILMQTVFLKQLELEELNDKEIIERQKQEKFIEDKGFSVVTNEEENEQYIETHSISLNQNMISVNILKLDKLMDLVGEMVIAAAMVVQNPDLKGLELDNFQKSAGHLKKITGELQDTVMSIRMIPLSATFQKMNRITRDMCKKLDKNVQLEIIGEETEVDKNIIEHISDPLMHIVRNAIDHGIEPLEMRISNGKNKIGKITLEAKNSGGDVLIVVKDDGRGLDKDKILKKAIENGLINTPQNDLTDREIFSYIFSPGFSTKDNVSEFSGRGVGMDVVTKNIEKVGGTVSVDSIFNEGTIVNIKIPLTLAIMDGMTIRVGRANYTVPLISIRESFRAKEKDIITDSDGNEMIMIRGVCYPVLRLHKLYKVRTQITNISDGIILMVENETKALCIFVDELIGEHQVVVKALPEYIKNFKRARGVEGCTLLGDGSISLILSIAELIHCL